MKTPNLVIAALLWASTALQGEPLSEHPLFMKLQGSWAGEGTISDAAGLGAEKKITESWTGTMTESGIFLIKGRRSIGQLEHDYSWEFHSNNGLIEGQMKIGDLRLDLRFEATVSEADRSITLTIPLNPGGTVLTIVNTLSEDGKSLSGTVEVKDETGKVKATGSATHRKQE